MSDRRVFSGCRGHPDRCPHAYRQRHKSEDSETDWYLGDGRGWTLWYFVLKLAVSSRIGLLLTCRLNTLLQQTLSFFCNRAADVTISVNFILLSTELPGSEDQM